MEAVPGLGSAGAWAPASLLLRLCLSSCRTEDRILSRPRALGLGPTAAGEPDDFTSKTSRSLLPGEAAAGLWEGLLPFCDWIRARTEYIDGVLDAFLAARSSSSESESGTSGESESSTSGESELPPYQVVLMGAGYDTRSLRKQSRAVNFFEVDLPEIVEGKGRLYGKYVKEHPDRSKLPTMLGMDLDEAKVERRPRALGGVLQVLQDVEPAVIGFLI